MDPDEVEPIKVSARAPISLERPVGDEKGSEFGQFMPMNTPIPRTSPQCKSSPTRAVRGAREAQLPRAARDRASLRDRRWRPVHTRRGRAHVQHHARADPPNREPLPQAAPIPPRGREAPRRRRNSCSARVTPASRTPAPNRSVSLAASRRRGSVRRSPADNFMPIGRCIGTQDR
jgi:hypothetical protein